MALPEVIQSQPTLFIVQNQPGFILEILPTLRPSSISGEKEILEDDDIPWEQKEMVVLAHPVSQTFIEDERNLDEAGEYYVMSNITPMINVPNVGEPIQIRDQRNRYAQALKVWRKKAKPELVRLHGRLKPWGFTYQQAVNFLYELIQSDALLGEEHMESYLNILDAKGSNIKKPNRNPDVDYHDVTFTVENLLWLERELDKPPSSGTYEDMLLVGEDDDEDDLHENDCYLASEDAVPEEEPDDDAAEFADVVELYLHDRPVSRRLTAYEERGVTMLLKNHEETPEDGVGLRALDVLMRTNKGLVIAEAKKHLDGPLPFADLIQSGNTGMLHGILGYDYTLNYKLSTYVTPWIMQEIMREEANKGRDVRLPVAIGATIAEIYRINDTLLTEIGQTPTPQEIAERQWKDAVAQQAKKDGFTNPTHDQSQISEKRLRDAGGRPLTAKKVKQHLVYAQESTSLEGTVNTNDDGDDPCVLGDVVTLPGSGTANRVEHELLRQELIAALSLLPPRSAAILWIRYGFYDGLPHSQREIGEMFGICKQNVDKIEKDAFRHIRFSKKTAVLRDYLFDTEELR